jgi:hypothetical protein
MDALKTRSTNFSGSWDEVCPHCGQKQETHRQIIGEVDGEVLERRKPCAPERERIRQHWSARVRATKIAVLIFWVLVPLAILILEFTNPLVGAVAFGLSLLKLGVEAIKFFGNPDKWIPGHRQKAERQRRMEHYVYHCERNPEGFARLRAENRSRDVEAPD